jgi:hypothetical protein
MFKTIRNHLAKTYGFTIIGVGFKKRHYTFTYSEAVEWAACHPLHGAVIYKGGIPVAYKGKITKPTVFKKPRKALTLDRVFTRSL